MEKLRRSAGLEARCSYGFRVSRFLAVKKQPDLKASVDAATDRCVAADRAVDDLERPVQEAVADRVLADGELDDLARLVARRLAARSVRAEREKPYTDVVPDGIGAYTEAKLEDETYVFGQLIERMETYLAEDDDVRVEFVPKVQEALDVWRIADAGVDAANALQDKARQARTDAVVAWEEAIESAYGTLMSRVGKTAADRCFPTSSARRSTKKASPASPAPGPASGAAAEPSCADEPVSAAPSADAGAEPAAGG